VAGQPVTRKVDEIILHNTYMPDIAGYKGPQTVYAIARFNIESQNWSNVGWHYMISPDGVIWTGRPLESNWSGVEGHGFHSDYNTLKKCPGDLISKQMVLKWMEEASH